MNITPPPHITQKISQPISNKFSNIFNKSHLKHILKDITASSIISNIPTITFIFMSTLILTAATLPKMGRSIKSFTKRMGSVIDNKIKAVKSRMVLLQKKISLYTPTFLPFWMKSILTYFYHPISKSLLQLGISPNDMKTFLTYLNTYHQAAATDLVHNRLAMGCSPFTFTHKEKTYSLWQDNSKAQICLQDSFSNLDQPQSVLRIDFHPNSGKIQQVKLGEEVIPSEKHTEIAQLLSLSFQEYQQQCSQEKKSNQKTSYLYDEELNLLPSFLSRRKYDEKFSSFTTGLGTQHSVSYNWITKRVDVKLDFGSPSELIHASCRDLKPYVNVQRHFELEFKQNRLIGVYLNGILLKKIPSDLKDACREMIEIMYEKLSSYTAILVGYQPQLTIEVHQRSIKISPLFHLTRLATGIRIILRDTQKFPNLLVSFFKEHATYSPAIDQGGVKREYLDTLFTHLIENSPLKFHKSPSYAFVTPQTQHTTQEPSILDDSLDLEEKMAYIHIGIVMGLCYRTHTHIQRGPFTNNIYFGHAFHPAMFKAILSLNEAEIHDDTLCIETKLKLSHALLTGYHDFGLNVTYLLKLCESAQDIQQLFSKESHCIEEKQVLSAANLLHMIDDELLPEKWIQEEGGKKVPHLQAILKDLPEFHQVLTTFFLQHEDSEFGNLNAQLQPLKAIAKGLYLCSPVLFNPHSMHQVDYSTVAQQIKGSINRQEIIESLMISETSYDLTQNPPFTAVTSLTSNGPLSPLKQKALWLVEWIEQATEKQLEQFLVFVGGYRGLSRQQKIKIYPQVLGDKQSVYPHAHTCAYALELSPTYLSNEEAMITDRTKEGFFSCLEKSFETGTPHGFSMA